jgi:hypothetical protein
MGDLDAGVCTRGNREDAVMTDERPHRSLAERISVHHDCVEHRHEEEELTEAAERAGVDLESDIGHPTARETPVSYDVDRDIGIENEPPGLHR